MEMHKYCIFQIFHVIFERNLSQYNQFSHRRPTSLFILSQFHHLIYLNFTHLGLHTYNCTSSNLIKHKEQRNRSLEFLYWSEAYFLHCLFFKTGMIFDQLLADVLQLIRLLLQLI